MKAFKNGFMSAFGRFLFKIFIAITSLLLFNYFFKDTDLTNLLYIDNVNAVSPSTWYYAREMRLYPSLIMQGNTSLQNGNNTFVVDSYNNVIPYIEFDRITTSGTRLVFNSPVVEGSHSIHLDIYSCQAPSFKNTFKTGDSSSTSALYEVDYIRHTTLSLANAQIAGTGSAILKNCRQDSYILNINSNGSGKYSSIELNYDSSYSKWYILGYDYQFDGLSTSYFGGLKTDINNNVNNRVSNATNDIITTINSNRTLINNNTNDRVWTATSNINDTATSNTNQQISNANSNTQEMISNNNSNFNTLNSNITDDNVDTGGYNSFFNNFNVNSHGIGDLVTLPLTFIQEFSDSTCEPINIPLWSNTSMTLPCLKPIEQNFLGNFYPIFVVLVNAPLIYSFINYFIMSVKNVNNPDDDRIEVVDL